MKAVAPNFFFISGASNSLSACSKNLKKIYRLVNFHANVLKWVNLSHILYFWFICCFLLFVCDSAWLEKLLLQKTTAIQMKAFEHLSRTFMCYCFIFMLYKVVLTFWSVDKILSKVWPLNQMKAIEQYFHVVLFIIITFVWNYKYHWLMI